MLNKLLIIFIYTFSLTAYELPQIEINKNNRAEITLFKATSVLVQEKLSYKIQWKTINATDVQITYLGKVAISGAVTITEDEYNRGPITLTASSRDNSYSDSKTININKKTDGLQRVIFKAPEENLDTYQYNTMPYKRRYNRAYRRRGY